MDVKKLIRIIQSQNLFDSITPDHPSNGKISVLLEASWSRHTFKVTVIPFKDKKNKYIVRREQARRSENSNEFRPSHDMTTTTVYGKQNLFNLLSDIRRAEINRKPVSMGKLTVFKHYRYVSA